MMSVLMTVEEQDTATREAIDKLEAELRLEDLQDKLGSLKIEKERHGLSQQQTTKDGDETVGRVGHRTSEREASDDEAQATCG